MQPFIRDFEYISHLVIYIFALQNFEIIIKIIQRIILVQKNKLRCLIIHDCESEGLKYTYFTQNVQKMNEIHRYNWLQNNRTRFQIAAASKPCRKKAL
jgi:hypothetical protein